MDNLYKFMFGPGDEASDALSVRERGTNIDRDRESVRESLKDTEIDRDDPAAAAPVGEDKLLYSPSRILSLKNVKVCGLHLLSLPPPPSSLLLPPLPTVVTSFFNIAASSSSPHTLASHWLPCLDHSYSQHYSVPNNDFYKYLLGPWKRTLEWREFGGGFAHLRTSNVAVMASVPTLQFNRFPFT